MMSLLVCAFVFLNICLLARETLGFCWLCQLQELQNYVNHNYRQTPVDAIELTCFSETLLPLCSVILLNE